MERRWAAIKRIYGNGPVVTMEDVGTAEAVCTDAGAIVAVGALDSLRGKYPDAEWIDLQGAALLPAFIDAHSHITALAQTMGLAPLAGAESADAVCGRLAERLKAAPPADGEWLMGFGYDQSAYSDGRRPTRWDLDRVSDVIPILITHASGHMAVCNTPALRALGVEAETPDPEGGRIGRGPGGEPDGYLEEAAFTGRQARIPPPSKAQQFRGMDLAQETYLSYGITLAQDGLTRGREYALLEEYAREGRLKLDVVGYADVKACPELYTQGKAGVGRLRMGGWKLFLDGSPQGRTAWMTQPYEGAEDGYRGYPIYTDEAVRAFVAQAVEERVQLLTHCNGDAAAQQLMDAFRRAGGAAGTRPVMIHAQTLRRDQLPALQELGMIASFFVAHTDAWGDVHLKNLGRERGGRISPVRSALDAGVAVTFHQDTPVLPPDMLHTVWCAAVRRAKSGAQLDPTERVTVLEGLRAVTIDAAYQYFEERRRGSLAPGKLADFVILSENPLTVPVDRLRKLKVLATVKEGREVWRA